MSGHLSYRGAEFPVLILCVPGESLGIDVCSLYHKESFLKYSVSLIGYGYYGDLLQDSEGLRWMGPNRYKWCGEFLSPGFLSPGFLHARICFVCTSQAR